MFRLKAVGDPSDTENQLELMSFMQVGSKYSRNRFSYIESPLLHRGPLRNTEISEGGDGGDGKGNSRGYTNMGLAARSYKG